MCKYIIVVGPCSTGTRLARTLIGSHPDIECGKTEFPVSDKEPFDDYWDNDFIKGLPQTDKPYLLTWRSIPHRKLNVPKLLETFYTLNSNVRMIITSRAIGPAIASARIHHVNFRNPDAAGYANYCRAYSDIFDVMALYDVNKFIITSLEGFIHERHEYLTSIWKWLGLTSHGTGEELFSDVKEFVNEKYFNEATNA